MRLMPLILQAVAVLLLTVAPVCGQPAKPAPWEVHPAFADLAQGADISPALQQAVDAVRSRGGRIVLPAGTYRMTHSVDLAGTLRKFPNGGPQGMTLEGNGAVLIWEGKDEGAVLDLPGITGCAVRNLTLRGHPSRQWNHLIGLRYRGGLERRNHGGKNNLFETIGLEHLGIGVETGGLFGPDLVGGTFLNVAVRDVRIGFRFMGQNVTSMLLLNPVVEGYRQAGIEIIAFPGRQVRANSDEPRQAPPTASNPGVLMDAEGEREIFQSDLPAWMSAPEVTYPTQWISPPGGKRWLQAGGGGLEVTVYGLRARSASQAAWAVDTNWGNVRIYGGEVAGAGGVFRSRVAMGFGHYTTLLKDVVAPDARGPEGNSVQLLGKGPLYLLGGTYGGQLALGRGAEVYEFGAVFAAAPPVAGLVRRYHPTQTTRTSLWPTPGSTELTVAASEGGTFLPGFNAGGHWVERTSTGHLRLRWRHPAPEGAFIDAVLESPSIDHP